MKKETTDVFDLLPPDANALFDEIGYAFLEEQGYDTRGCATDEKRMYELRKALKRDNRDLRHHVFENAEERTYLIWFTLHENGVEIAKSRSMKFIASGRREASDNAEGDGQM